VAAVRERLRLSMAAVTFLKITLIMLSLRRALPRRNDKRVFRKAKGPYSSKTNPSGNS
jgi:hypothetical protein